MVGPSAKDFYPLREIYIRNHERFLLMAVNQPQSSNMKYDFSCFDPIQIQIKTMIAAVLYCVRGTRKQPLICVGCSVNYWVSCAINKGGFIEIAFFVVVDTNLPRFEALPYVLPHFDALTHVVIRVSSAFIFQTFAEVCYSVFVNRSSFKSVLNLRKAYIGVAEGLL